MNSDPTDSAISSPESADGPSPSSLPDGPQTDPSGPDPVPVSRFRSQEQEKALPTNDTCGPLFNRCSPSAALQSALESRLQANLGVNGSPEFELTWKDWDMPAGPPICRLAASGRRTSAKDCSGWPTPNTSRGGKRKGELLMGGLVKAWPTPTDDNANNAAGHKGTAFQDLPTTAQTAWPTPAVRQAPTANLDPDSWTGTNMKKLDGRKHQTDLQITAMMAVNGWATPTEGDAKSSGSRNTKGSKANEGQSLTDQARGDSGKGRSPSNVETEKPAASLLNPRFSLWLQGYPGAWASSGERAMRSSRK